ncbi:MAG TPA: hypothetical protein VJP40_06975 [bacterium]|nr:hypothetical protein [bacterium]
MSIQVQVPVSNLLVSGLSSISSLPPVQVDAETNSQSSQDVYIPMGQGPDMRPASFHLNQFWTLMGQPVDMATEGQSPDMVVQPPDMVTQPPDMVAGQPVDM